jgi:hypothetical protein
MANSAKRIGLALAMVPIAMAVLFGGDARADLNITIQQVGNDVVTTATGSLDITGVPIYGNGYGTPFLIPVIAAVGVGSTSSLHYEEFQGVSGPTSFGSGGIFSPSSGSGDVIALNGAYHLIAVPWLYVSGTSLSGTDTYDNQTLSSLGLTPGTHTYTFADNNITVQISSAAAVPEPSTAVVAVFGAVAFLSYGWSRRRRAQRRLAAA